ISVNGPDPVTIELIAEEKSLLDMEVLTPDSTVFNERHRITDTAFAWTFRPERGESRISMQLTDRFGNDTAAAVTVRRADVRTRSGKPLYNPIAVRPAGDHPEQADANG